MNPLDLRIALAHPESPHIAALLDARAYAAGQRDLAEDDEAREEAEIVIVHIDRALDVLGYHHFTEGGIRWDQQHDVIAAFAAWLSPDPPPLGCSAHGRRYCLRCAGRET